MTLQSARVYLQLAPTHIGTLNLSKDEMGDDLSLPLNFKQKNEGHESYHTLAAAPLDQC